MDFHAPEATGGQTLWPPEMSLRHSNLKIMTIHVGKRLVVESDALVQFWK